MKIFLDFDRTLYDLDSFLMDLRGVFEKHGVTAEEFAISRANFAHWDGDSKPKYTIEKHVQNFPKLDGSSANSIIADFHKLLRNGHKYVFEDTHDFINESKERELIILTFGDDESQKKKIFGSGVGDVVSDVVVTSLERGKWRKMSELVKPGEKAFFVDDSIKYFNNQNYLDNVHGVHLVRVDKGYIPCVGCEAAYHVKDLAELKKIITEYE